MVVATKGGDSTSWACHWLLLRGTVHVHVRGRGGSVSHLTRVVIDQVREVRSASSARWSWLWPFSTSGKANRAGIAHAWLASYPGNISAGLNLYAHILQF